MISIFSVAILTLALSTPSIFLTAFSTAFAHDAQVIPVTL
ncbi:putative membrane protein [[Clostridium] sordellii VPI 9048]|nr:putative membrane protein [[Clostridium] sordellii VPI 9048] [Paeniclostridium sordellii VPI 9048]